MKNDLTTGIWQDNIWCPINIILLCTADVVNDEAGNGHNSKKDLDNEMEYVR